MGLLFIGERVNGMLNKLLKLIIFVKDIHLSSLLYNNHNIIFLLDKKYKLVIKGCFNKINLEQQFGHH